MKNACRVLCVYTLLFASRAFSWGDIGHQTVAQIAEENLDPKTKLYLDHIFGPEPILAAAIWPDLVRSDKRFKEFDPYHFVEVPLGLTYEKKQAIPGHFAEKDAFTMILQVPKAVLKKELPREVRMILLRYLMHTVGDVHQPLHTGNGMDMGANLCDIKWKGLRNDKFYPTDLHSFMDDGIIEYIKEKRLNELEKTKSKEGHYFGALKFAAMIKKEIPDGSMWMGEKVSYKTLSDTPVLDWVVESQSYHKIIYPDRAPVKHPIQRTYCKILETDKDNIPLRVNGRTNVIKGNYDPTTLPELDHEYAEKILPVIKFQILKGGLRLAKILNEIAANDGGTYDAPDSLIKAPQLKNPNTFKKDE